MNLLFLNFNMYDTIILYIYVASLIMVPRSMTGLRLEIMLTMLRYTSSSGILHFLAVLAMFCLEKLSGFMLYVLCCIFNSSFNGQVDP